MVYFKWLVLVVMLSCITTLSFAEEAPVFDADHDNYPPAFDSSSDAVPLDETPAPPHRPTAAERLAKLELELNNLQQANSPRKLETLQTEVQSLRNQVEELSHHLEELQTQQKTIYTDLDNRINQLLAKADEKADHTEKPAASSQVNAAPIPKKSITNNVDQPNSAEEQRIYQTAYDLIKAKKYQSAITTLQKMLQKYPSGQFAANAHYWLGELYGLLNQNEQSADEFSTIVKNYPESPKVSDAQLKLGLIYIAQFKWNDAKDAFRKVVNQYPGTASARLATEQLKQIKKAGH